MGNIIGTDGMAILYIFLYLIAIVILGIKIGKILTESRGIKNLKYQEYNLTWNKYVTRKGRKKNYD